MGLMAPAVLVCPGFTARDPSPVSLHMGLTSLVDHSKLLLSADEYFFCFFFWLFGGQAPSRGGVPSLPRPPLPRMPPPFLLCQWLTP